MKRSFALFVAFVFMVSAMCLSAFAATSYIFTGTNFHFDTGTTYMPSGYYHARVYGDISEHTLLGYTIEPFYFSHSAGTYLIPASSLFLLDPDSMRYASSDYDYFLRWSNNDPSDLFLFFKRDGADWYFKGEFYLELIPVGDLLPAVNADVLPAVFDQIIGLLPVALGVLIAFVGIRKGISFLRQIMHSA